MTIESPFWGLGSRCYAANFSPFSTSREKSGLDEACRYLQSLFLRPAWVLRETEYPWRIWLQTFPITWERLLTTPFNRRQVYLSGEAPGLMPLVRTKSGDDSGFELIAEEGGTPVFLDLYKKHKNLGLSGTTRSGKSVVAAGILTQALVRGMPVVAMDYPKPDGSSTFTDYTHFLGEDGAYFDIGRESSNLFELPDLSGLDPKLQAERFEDYKDFLSDALMAMVLGTKRGGTVAERTLSDTVRSILALALDAFFSDLQIRDRYSQSYTCGLGSPEWSAMPTLVDFLSFCSLERLRLDSVAGDAKAGLEQVKLRLRFWLSSRVGKAISQPSTFRSDARLLVFALRNLSNDEDAAILSLSAYSAALRRALAAPASIFFIDESPILFEYDSIAALVGRLCANGAKAGIRVILSAQDPDTIAKSPSASKIFQNLTTRLIGRIQPTAVDSFVQILKYPREIISRNATESFFPKKEGIYSALQDAYQQAMQQLGSDAAARSLLSQCASITDPTQQADCVKKATQQAQQLNNSQPSNGNIFTRDFSKEINEGISTILAAAVKGWLIAFGIAFQWIVEISLLLTGLLGPLAVGGSLLPIGQKSIFAWLTGFFSVGMVKLCFNIIVGLVATLVINAENADSMVFAFATGLLAPVLSLILAAGGGMAVFNK